MTVEWQCRGIHPPQTESKQNPLPRFQATFTPAQIGLTLGQALWMLVPRAAISLKIVDNLLVRAFCKPLKTGEFVARKTQKTINSEQIQMIINGFNQEAITRSSAYPDGGIDPLWPRFERAVMNQMEGGAANFSRYAVWANTVRDNIIEAIGLLEEGKQSDARILLVRAANSLSAFSEIQAHFDPDK